MRVSTAAIALIQRDIEGRKHWLAQWNSGWQAYSFIGGHKRPDETFRECVIREVAEELQLREGEDFDVAETPLARVEYEAWSESAQQITAYTVELLLVKLNGAPAFCRIELNPGNCWVNRQEIQLGRAADGRRISPTMKRLLEQLGSST